VTLNGGSRCSTPVANTKAFKEAAKNANVLVLNVRRGSVAQLIQIR